MRTSLITLLLAAGVCSGQDAPKVGTPIVVPFKLSKTQHVVVRAKIDGKGPFHLVVDTGCPVLLISKEAADKAGLKVERGKATIDGLELEGGLTRKKVAVHVETPFQIDAMNGMGLPGIELHGLLGYTELARYRIEIDLSRERMTWTPLAFDPPPLEKLRGKDGGANNIEIMGALLKLLAQFSGLKPPPPAVPRGFSGVVLEQRDKGLHVAAVFENSPAAAAGLKAGDRIASIGDRPATTVADALAAIANVHVGQDVVIAVDRDGERTNIKIKTASGF